ncbi:MAG TPA: dihydrodipicolinate synthase family protein [Solirubrobacteraceae bacterium]|nr:dihydrodipicolinate synthase family protein [Solirubrobacteraceae bacterium]
MLAAIATPYGPDGGLDLDAFDAHIAWLAEEGLDGVFVAGTTGEGVLLEHDEVGALVERAVGGSLRVIAQIGRPSTRATVALAERAIAAGADAVAAYVPWFYPVSQVQLREHFLALLRAAGDTPAFMYNIPPRTVNDLDPSLAGELASAGFAGMKDSTGDFARHEAYLDAVSGHGSFELYTGTEPFVLRSVRAGAAGSITALANCVPELFVGLRDALAAGDEAEAGRLQDQITVLKEQTRAEESTVAAIKRRVRERLAQRSVDYPAAPRAPFT